MDTTSNPPKQSFLDRLIGFVESLPIGDRFLLKGTLAVFMISLLWLAVDLNAGFLIEVPGSGGALREGVVGTPRFINPVLAVTAADQDLAALVYSGLMRLDKKGEIVPDLAESVTVSEDGLVYDVVLKDGVTFHDGTPLSADDMMFTVSRIQDPAVKSPTRASWEGVAIERKGDREIQFTLTEPYAPFIENLTVGILPRHIWEGVTSEEFPFSQYNSEPIGAGPYKITAVSRNDAGIPETYELTSSRTFSMTAPRIKKLFFHFYPTEEALGDAFIAGTVQSAGGLSKTAIDRLRAASVPFTLKTVPLPRTFAFFFNQNSSTLLRDGAARKALARAVDRDAIIEDALGGYGEAITSPIPPGFGINMPAPEPEGAMAAQDDARGILRDGGWRINEKTGRWEKKIDEETVELAFSIATANTPVFEKTAELLKQQWGALGVPVTVRQFEQSDLIQTVIRPRQYETLLFGTVVGRELDFFSFWHSSQRNDPGLNVALYANVTTDGLLSAARAARTFEERAELYRRFSEEIAEETPAIFLYVPTYTYAVSPAVRGVTLSGIARGSERLSTIGDWFMEEDSVWPLFTDRADTTDAPQ